MVCGGGCLLSARLPAPLPWHQDTARKQGTQLRRVSGVQMEHTVGDASHLVLPSRSYVGLSSSCSSWLSSLLASTH